MIRYDPADLKRIKALVKKECCNYDSGNCVLLDDGETCVCPQTISYSLLCKWFRNAVLPLDNDLYIKLMRPKNTKTCVICGSEFESKSNSVKYCPNCRKKVTRKQAAKRKQKQRDMSRSRGSKST